MNIQNNPLSKVLGIIQEIAAISAVSDYIYRGEPRHYKKVSSSLYREYPEIEEAIFDVDFVQSEMLKAAKEYTSEADDFAILTKLQHYGGATNLIDFTTDYLIALFFACDSHFEKRWTNHPPSKDKPLYHRTTESRQSHYCPKEYIRSATPWLH